MKPRPCVYIATNKVNGKQYVGQTVDFKRRMLDHRNGKLCFDCALRKYGINQFSFHKIYLTEDELDEWERFYVNILNTIAPNGYNIAKGGNVNYVSVKEKKLGRIASVIFGKMAERVVGGIVSASVDCQRHLSAETRKKISESQKRRLRKKNE